MADLHTRVTSGFASVVSLVDSAMSTFSMNRTLTSLSFEPAALSAAGAGAGAAAAVGGAAGAHVSVAVTCTWPATDDSSPATLESARYPLHLWPRPDVICPHSRLATPTTVSRTSLPAFLPKLGGGVSLVTLRIKKMFFCQLPDVVRMILRVSRFLALRIMHRQCHCECAGASRCEH
jgi:hypothetical protein